jgi:hypothetical protein
MAVLLAIMYEVRVHDKEARALLARVDKSRQAA